MDKFNWLYFKTDKSQIKIDLGNLRIFRKHTSEPKLYQPNGSIKIYAKSNMCIMLTKDKVPGGFT